MVISRRVNLPKSFIAINLSDAFSFPKNQHVEDSKTLDVKQDENQAVVSDQEVAPGESSAAANDVAPADDENSLSTPIAANGGPLATDGEQAAHP
jgi:hypothetical protein